MPAECDGAGVAVPREVLAGTWLLVPLTPERRPARGGLAIRGARETLTAADLPSAVALAALAGLALGRVSPDSGSAEPSWQEALDLIDTGLCVIDGSGRIRRANKAFTALLDGHPGFVVGQPWRTLVPADWVSALELVIGGATPARHVEVPRNDRLLAVTGTPLPGADDGGVVLAFTDQTAQSRLQHQLVQAEKMSAIGQLIAGVAHDLNNPLASVVGFAEFLSEHPEVPAPLREPVSVIREEAERASGIVKNLLGFVRKQERQRRPTPIQPLLEATLALLRNELNAARVEALLEIDDDLPLPIIDPIQIQQVFVNLIHNAIQAIAGTGRPGTVLVTARRWGDGLALRVVDDGPGIPESLAAQVFHPFFTTKPEGQGTGLGLSVSQGIVTDHGGRITVETGNGPGATFTVHLLGSGEVEPPAVARGAGPDATPLRILVVDDEPHILHYMRATLESWGHTVAEAADGEEARRRMIRDRFDLVVADLRMPGLGGREFYEQLHREEPALAQRVVFATGDTVRGDTLDFLRSVGRPYLRKPFSLTELRSLLAGVSKASGG
jgi:two-component system NtrC family sensor kinase